MRVAPGNFHTRRTSRSSRSAPCPAAGSTPQGKFIVKKLPDGNKVLAKVNTDARPPIARANAYITWPNVGELHHPGRRDGDDGSRATGRTWASSTAATR